MSDELPQDLEAEQATLGAMMLNAKVCGQCRLIIAGADDFLQGVHRQIYEVIETIYDNGEAPDLVEVSAELRRRGQMKDISGEYLTALQQKPPTAAHGLRYARIVVEKSIQRELIRVGADIQKMGYEQADAEQTIADATDRLFNLRTSTELTTQAEPIRNWCDEYYDWQWELMHKPPGVEGARLGIPSIDKQLGGFADWEMVLFKAREKFGKTSLLRHSALTTAMHGVPILIYILEGNKTRYWQGCVAWLAGVPASLLRRGGASRQTDEQTEAIVQAQADLSTLPIYISSGVRTVKDLQADMLAQWSAAQDKPQAVYIDYIQRITCPDATSRVQQIERALQMMLAVNERTGMPIITASQINREDGTFYSSEAQHAAAIVWQIERGPEGAEMDADEARMCDEVRLVNTHKRYGPMLRPRELEADWPSGRFRDIADEYNNQTR